MGPVGSNLCLTPSPLKTTSVGEVAALAALADSIDADLVGDEGELYEVNGGIVRPPAPARSQRLRWFLRRNAFNIVLYVSIGCVLIYLSLR